MTEKVIGKVFNSLVTTNEYKELAQNWSEAYNNSDKEKMNQIYGKYGELIDKKIKDEFGISLKSDYMILHSGETQLVFGNDTFTPANNLYGAYIPGVNTNVINLNYNDEKFNLGLLDDINTISKHEIGVHNFYNTLFNSNSSTTNRIIKNNKLERYEKISKMKIQLPKNFDPLNTILYLIEPEEAIARHAEKFN